MGIFDLLLVVLLTFWLVFTWLFIWIARVSSFSWRLTHYLTWELPLTPWPKLQSLNNLAYCSSIRPIVRLSFRSSVRVTVSLVHQIVPFWRIRTLQVYLWPSDFQIKYDTHALNVFAKVGYLLEYYHFNIFTTFCYFNRLKIYDFVDRTGKNRDKYSTICYERRFSVSSFSPSSFVTFIQKTFTTQQLL